MERGWCWALCSKKWRRHCLLQEKMPPRLEATHTRRVLSSFWADYQKLMFAKTRQVAVQCLNILKLSGGAFQSVAEE